ncbi:MAG TPA: DUF1376 domain-containing protein [Bryobacteraceae bacterium]|jgi:uncharacterized protein YdaU (DUF1376 family)|nr:DUF1376 domain-containing protein [Bryobacteraceae bacterium]
MTRSNPLWFLPLDVAEWRGDRRISKLTDYQRGWLIQLLIECWQNKGFLPTDLTELAEIAGASRTATFEKYSGPVLAFFTEDQGHLIHAEMKTAYEAALAAYQKKTRKAA